MKRQKLLLRLNQTSINNLVVNTDVLKAEIIWALRTVKLGLSHWSNDNIAECFKATYIVNHGLSPFFKNLLIESINKSNHYFHFLTKA